MSLIRLQKLPIVAEPDSSMPFFLRLLLTFGIEFLKGTLVSVLSAFLTPVPAMFLKFGGDVLANILVDVSLGVNPLSGFSLSSNLVFPMVGIFRKINTVRRFNKNYLRTLGKLSVEHQESWYSMHNKFGKMGWDKLEYTKFERNYQIIENQFHKVLVSEMGWMVPKKIPKSLRTLGRPRERWIVSSRFTLLDNLETKKFSVMRTFPQQQSLFQKRVLKAFKEQAELREQFRRFRHAIKKGGHYLNLVDPGYASRFFIAKLTKKYKQIINRYIDSWWAKFGKKFVNKTNELLYRSLIPLQHEDEPWIMGIRLFQGSILGHINIQFIFDPKITNNKKPVYLYEKSWQDVLRILRASSAGRFYINNICWGWKIGKIISKSDLIKTGFLQTSNLPYLSKVIGLSTSFMNKFNHAIVGMQKYWNLNQLKNSLIKGTQGGLMKSVHGANLGRTLIQTFFSGEDKYFKRYTQHFAYRWNKKRTKNWTRKKLGKEWNYGN